jgi:uncharacterized protein with FMN-binding domain
MEEKRLSFRLYIGMLYSVAVFTAMKVRIWMKRKILWGVGIILVLAVSGGIFYLAQVLNYEEKVRNIQIDELELTDKADGKYIGDCDVGLVYAKVEVTVKDGVITDINLLEHKNGKGEAAETMPAQVLKAQSLKIDAVAGATSSSKVILKAIDNALE